MNTRNLAELENCNGNQQSHFLNLKEADILRISEKYKCRFFVIKIKITWTINTFPPNGNCYKTQLKWECSSSWFHRIVKKIEFNFLILLWIAIMNKWRTPSIWRIFLVTHFTRTNIKKWPLFWKFCKNRKCIRTKVMTLLRKVKLNIYTCNLQHIDLAYL